MYERYTVPARRAVFFAVWCARLEEAPAINSVHLLRGIMWDDDSRCNTVFHLREHFPLYRGDPHKFASSEDVPNPMLALDNACKRILAWAATEAGSLNDYWIDTEHLLLGILAERSSVAAEYLAKTGLTLKDARRIVVENRSSRPDYGPVPPQSRLQSPLQRWISKWRMRKNKH